MYSWMICLICTYKTRSPQKMKGFSVSKFSLLKMVPSKHHVDFSGLQKPFVHSKTTLLINVVAITTELSLKVKI